MSCRCQREKCYPCQIQGVMCQVYKKDKRRLMQRSRMVNTTPFALRKSVKQKIAGQIWVLDCEPRVKCHIKEDQCINASREKRVISKTARFLYHAPRRVPPTFFPPYLTMTIFQTIQPSVRLSANLSFIAENWRRP